MKPTPGPWEVKEIAHNDKGELSLATINGRGFVHGSIMDEECSKRNAELARLRKENADMLGALRECGANWSSPPGTVMGAVAELGLEFKRRMQIAGDAVERAEASSILAAERQTNGKSEK